MKVNYILLISIAIITFGFKGCQAMLAFPEKSFTTKTGKAYTISLAQTDDEKEMVKIFLEKRFEKILYTPQHQDLCIYLSKKDSSKRLIAAAHFLHPTEERSYLFLSDMAVRSKYQNEGIGSTILSYLIEHTEYPIQLFSLTGAIDFYKKLGFYSYDQKMPAKMRREPSFNS